MTAPPGAGTPLRLAIPADEGAALAAVEEAAELWRGRCRRTAEGVEVMLPVQAGLRHGELRAEVRVLERADRRRLELSVREASYRLHRHGTALLALGALAALVTVVWPFWPALSGLVPVALIVAVATWFLVITRLENRGAEEFLGTVESLLSAPTAVEEAAAAADGGE